MFSKIKRIVFKIIIWFLVLSFTWVIFDRFVPIPITWLMLQRSVEQKIDGKDFRLKKEWVPIDEISDNLKKAVIAAEDQRFFEHNGFDMEAIEKAYERNQRGKKVRGGSTISQQCAKNVFLWPGRSWIRKGFEAYFTLLIEVFWSKERIMEVYLNVIEMGDGIYGAEAAAQFYFKKPASKLSRPQAALIAAVLPSPRKWSVKYPGPFVQRKQERILRAMSYLGPLDF